MNHESIVLAVKNKILIYSAKNLRKTLFTKDLSLSPLFYLENLKNCRQENPLALNLALLFSLLSKVRLFWEGQKFDEISQWICVWLMCGSCHINRATNAKFSVEFWMFVLIFFSADIRSERSPIHSKLSRLTKGTLEGASNFKTWLRLQNKTITNIQNSTLNSSFDTLSKWHDPDTNKRQNNWEIASNFVPFLEYMNFTYLEWFFWRRLCKPHTRTRHKNLTKSHSWFNP